MTASFVLMVHFLIWWEATIVPNVQRVRGALTAPTSAAKEVFQLLITQAMKPTASCVMKESTLPRMPCLNAGHARRVHSQIGLEVLSARLVPMGFGKMKPEVLLVQRCAPVALMENSRGHTMIQRVNYAT